ncbi:MAG: hypothetical protein VXZ12_13535 [SAR324 cluster bacterium]|nr:hypothetical protein [SAR324 cluster bacterium]
MNVVFIGRNLIFLGFQILFIFFLQACQSNSNPSLLYPSNQQVQLRLICSQAYSGDEARHQVWEKSQVRWLFITEDKVTVYFENDRTRLMPRKPGWTLPPGKYRCVF